MGGLELSRDITLGNLDPRQIRAAAVHIADQVAAEHPHELDDSTPKLAGRLIGRDPIVAAGVLELLDAIGLLPPGYARLKARETELKQQITDATDRNQRLTANRTPGGNQ